MMKKIALIFTFLTGTIFSYCQDIPLDAMVQNRYNEIMQHADTSLFTSFRAINWLEVKPYIKTSDTDIADAVFGFSDSKKDKLITGLSNNNWVQLSGKKNIITIDPYLMATGGFLQEDSSNRNAIANMAAGLRIQGVYDNKLSYSLTGAYLYNKFPDYINSFARDNQNYIPGVGKGTINNGGYTATQFTGNITWLAGKHLVVGAGYGKNFIGDGYRSLILSDNAANYPYLRLQARLWKITYNVLYNRFESPRYSVEGRPQQKYSVMHYLGVNFSKKLQMGLYDNVIWYAQSSSSQRGFEVQYLNPLIFLRPLEFALGSPDNAFVGITGKYKLYKNGFIYGQLGLDDLALTKSINAGQQSFGQKYVLQFGIWNKDVFHIKNLSYRLEWNGVRPYTYGHTFDRVGLNYTHNNQSLANPFNANFHEFISIFQYHNNRWYGTLENLYAIRGENPGLPYNNGEDLWGGQDGVPNYGSTTLQGIHHTYFFNQLSGGYLLNPKNRLALQADLVYRNSSIKGGSAASTFYLSFGIKTRLFNNYNDF